MTGCVELTRKVLELVAQGDLDAALDLISDDFVSYEAASLPYGGTYRGKAGFRDLIVKLGQTWSLFDFKIHDIVGSDTVAVVVETISGTVGDRAFEMPVLEIWRARDGMIIEATPHYHDTHLLWALRQEQTA